MGNNVMNSMNIAPSSARKGDKIISIGGLRITEKKENKSQIDKIYENLSINNGNLVNKNIKRPSSGAPRVVNLSSSSNQHTNKIISFNVSENKNYHSSQKNPTRSPSYGPNSDSSSQKKGATPRKSNYENYHEISSVKIIGDDSSKRVIDFNSLYSNKHLK